MYLRVRGKLSASEDSAVGFGGDTRRSVLRCVIVRSREELCRWLRDPLPGLKWLQVEGMLGDSDAWMEVGHSDSRVSLDLILADPSSEFSDLYKLVDASAVHDVRVTIHGPAGFA